MIFVNSDSSSISGGDLVFYSILGFIVSTVSAGVAADNGTIYTAAAFAVISFAIALMWFFHWCFSPPQKPERLDDR